MYLNYLNLKTSNRSSKRSLTQKKSSFCGQSNFQCPLQTASEQALNVGLTPSKHPIHCISDFFWNVAVRHLLFQHEAKKPFLAKLAKNIACSHETLLLRYEPFSIFIREALGQLYHHLFSHLLLYTAKLKADQICQGFWCSLIFFVPTLILPLF